MVNKIRIYLFLLLLWMMCFSACSKKELDTKKILRYNSEDGIGSLDPAFASNLPNWQAVSQLYNGLVTLDSNLNVVPSIASSWQVSADHKAYTFNIRPAVFFHDHPLFKEGKGREVTAYDFEYALKRICDTTGLFNQGIWIFKDIVLKNDLGQLSDTCFKALDDRTFKIYLDQPAPHLLQVLTMAYAFVVPHEVVDKMGLDFRKSPVGTGPFKLGEWIEGEMLVLYKNENYWKKDTKGNSLPYLDAVEISFMPDKGQVFRSFVMGKLDFIRNIEESSLDEVLYRDGTIKEHFLEKFRVQKTPYFNTEYLGFQLDPKAEVYQGSDQERPFLNVDFRRALSYAVDREKIISYLKNSMGYPGEHGLIPPPTPYVDVSKIKGHHFDPVKARAYLEQSGLDLETLPKLELTLAKEHQPLIEFLAKTWWQELGVKIDLDIKESKTARVLVSSGKTALFKQSWLGDYPEAGNYMSLLYSGNFTPFGPNKMHFQNRVCDSLYERSQITLDEQERSRLYAEMDAEALNEVPMIILFYDELLQLSQKNVKGLQANAMNLLVLETVDKK